MHGNVTLQGTTYEDVATYSCNLGFLISGRRTRKCLIDGYWSESAPTCSSMKHALAKYFETILVIFMLEN